MKILTKQTIETELKALWDNVMRLQDEPTKDFAASRISQKEKDMYAKLQAQESLIKYLDRFAYDSLCELLDLLNDTDVRRLLVNKFGRDKEAVTTIMFVFKTIVLLLNKAI